MTELRAGAAEIDITPPMGTHMGGDLCRIRPVEKVLDPLYARALVVESGNGAMGERICLLSLDLCTSGNDISDRIRRMVADKFGFDFKAVMFHLLQNHSAPSLGTHILLREDSEGVNSDFWWVYHGDQDYPDFLIPRIMDVVEQAVSQLEPVSIACHGMADSRCATNRRFVTRDGWVQSQPQDMSNVLHVEGPADPEVGLACFKNRDGKNIATVLHHTAHPVSHFGKNWVTASWPGSWAHQMREHLDEGCVPIVINGCCGNVNAWDHTDPGATYDHDTIAARLTETSLKVLDKLNWRDSGEAAFNTEKMVIPFSDMARQIGQRSIDHARKVIDDEPAPRWSDKEHTALDIEWVFSLVVLELCKLKDRGGYDYEVQTFRIGQLGIVGLIGEPFVEGQLKIKLQSPFERTFVAHMCNGWVGYIPPVASYNAKSYNFMTPDGLPVRRGANLFLMEEDALDRITDKSVELLKLLHDSPSS